MLACDRLAGCVNTILLSGCSMAHVVVIAAHFIILFQQCFCCSIMTRFDLRGPEHWQRWVDMVKVAI